MKMMSKFSSFLLMLKYNPALRKLCYNPFMRIKNKIFPPVLPDDVIAYTTDENGEIISRLNMLTPQEEEILENMRKNGFSEKTISGTRMSFMLR